MLKSALGIIVSLFALTIGTPAAQVHAATPAKASAKKQSVKKPAAKRKVEASTRASKSTLKTSVASRSKFVKKVAVRSKRQSSYQHVAFAPSTPVVPAPMTAGDLAGLHMTRDPLALKSNAALVIDQNTAQVLFEKNSNVALPIASLTKLMTALVVIEARQNMDEVLEVTADDIDRERNSSSRLRVGALMTRADMLHIALMSSENRAASALGRHYPGGLSAFVAAMNAKAKMLGMKDTYFVDSTGLSSRNVASARDLAKLVVAAYQHPIIRDFSTDPGYAVSTGRYQLNYMNSNRLVKNPSWDIGLQKTGYITEAGRCLVMQARIDGRPVVMVFLDSKGKDSRLADAGRIRKWLELSRPQALTQTVSHQG
ncbi:MAG TPA: D-alanyl-D-alanine endopeptidase [Noviherbaspirillum sp.]|nr:D-alanyl-D-alanine endopeptidase [Noviherbaspirillum sp.]